MKNLVKYPLKFNYWPFLLALILFSLKMPADCYSQEYVVKGMVMSQKNLKPLLGASVVDSTTGKGSITNENGEFAIALKSFPGHICIDYLGYNRFSLIIKDSLLYNSTLKDQVIPILMEEALIQMEQVVIKPFIEALDFTQINQHAIIQFIIWESKIICKVFENNNPLNKALYVLNFDGEMEFHKTIPGFDELSLGPSNECLVLTNKEVFSFWHTDQGFILQKEFERSEFEKRIRPIKAKNKRNVILSYQPPNQQFIEFFTLDIVNSTSKLFHLIGKPTDEMAVDNLDKSMRDLFQQNISRSYISSGELMEMRERIANIHFELNTDFRKVRSDFFNMHDTVLIVDYSTLSIDWFNFAGELLRKTDIKIDHPTSENCNFLIDRALSEGYLVLQEKAGNRIERLDLYTGVINGDFFIKNFKELENIIINDRFGYFLYLDQHGNGNKRLYKLPLQPNY